MPATEQLAQWEGEFGRQYADRNVVDWTTIAPLLKPMLDGVRPERVLEVGCNRGHNLVALADLYPEATLFGVEPAEYARSIAKTAHPRVWPVPGTAFDLPYKDGFFDLVFTAGVLIHIAPADLPKAMAEIHRVSRRWVMGIEYSAAEPTAIPYRGHTELLWKRDFGAEYQRLFPNLRLVRTGVEPQWESSTYWVFEKA